MCKVTSRWAGSRGELVDPPPSALAILAAVLRKQPGKRDEMDVWDMRELSDGSLRGNRLSNAEIDELNLSTQFVEYIKKIKQGMNVDVVVVDPVEDWVNTMVLAYPHQDPQYGMSYRERRIAESLYWLQRQVPVILMCGERQRVENGEATGIEPNLAPAVVRQSDAIIHVVGGKGTVKFAHEHTGLKTGPVSTDDVAGTLGFLVTV
jgi:hypothetical protein